MRVLLVGGAPDGQAVITRILESDPEILVLGAVDTGEEALQILLRSRPDVVLMDIETPLVRGAEAHQRIMEAYPVPIVLVADSYEAAARFGGNSDALPPSTVAMVARPRPEVLGELQAGAADLLQATRLMAEVKVVRRWVRGLAGPVAAGSGPASPARAPLRILAIGASTGGPSALKALLSGLPPGFDLPALIVHHISPGFLAGLVDWLSGCTPLKLSIAAQGVLPQPGHGYFAPDGFQMGVDAEGRIVLSTGEPENGLRPSVSHLFRSVALVYGPDAAGVLLTGMGKDGAEELREMRDRGAVTFAQDQESSAVYGMPGEAARLDAATYILPPEAIAVRLRALARHNPIP